MQGTFPKKSEVNCLRNEGEDRFLVIFFKFRENRHQKILPPYVCIGNYLHNRLYLKSYLIFFCSV